MKKQNFFYVLIVTGILITADTKAQTTLSPQRFEKLKSATFRDVEGKEFQLSQYKGKVVLVEFWETWCGPCVKNMPALDKVAAENKDKLVVLAIDALMKDDEKAFEHYTSKHKNNLQYATGQSQLLKELDIHFIPFKILIDTAGNYSNAYESAQDNKEDEYEALKGSLNKLIPQKQQGAQLKFPKM